MSGNLSKYIASFDYLDRSLIVLSVATGSISIASFATVTGASVGTASAIFSLKFSISTGNVKKRKQYNKRNRKSTIKLLC